MQVYVKAPWPERDIPEGEPDWSYYEVEDTRDVVTRIIALFRDGRAIRNSMERAAREGPDHRSPEHRSLVHGSFLRDTETRQGLLPMTRSEFEALWQRAFDRPWP